MNMTIVVVGATGAIGGAALRGLLDEGQEVRATSRRPEAAQLPAGVEVHRADLEDPRSFTDALRGAERVFLYADLEDPAAMVAVMEDSGVRQVVLLSSWAAAKEGAETDFNGARFAAAESALRRSRLDWTFVRPGTFASNAARWRWEIARTGALRLPFPDSQVDPVHDRDIVDIAVRALTTDDLRGEAPVLTGPEVITLRRQVADIADAVGRPIDVVEQDPAEAHAAMSQHMSPGWADYIIDGWRAGVTATPIVSDDYARITGRPAWPFSQWAADNADLFR